MEIFLEVSNLCDLKCAMCPTFSGLSPSRFYSIKEQERGLIDLEALTPHLDEALKRAISVHCFGYGEPTLHTGFVELLRHLGRYRVLIDFFTNGMHLDTALCEHLVERQVFSVTVSASGADRETYEGLYLGGRFETLLAGLQRLAACKRAHGSRYPRVEINSIAFDRHVQRLPEFVDLMASHGAEVIHLKTLQTFVTTKEIAGHRSILRPWVEGEILRQAGERASARQVALSYDQYRLTQVEDETAWRAARGDTSATLPVESLAERARQVQPGRPPPEYRADPQVSAMQLTPEALDQALEFDDYAGKTPFYCFEPFKTLYVRRSGNVKPCCFANDAGPALGSLTEQDALRVWDAPPARRIRESILAQRYPRALCGHCLKHGYGPRQQDIPNRLIQYRDWLLNAWGDGLPIEIPSTTLTNQEIVRRWRAYERSTEDARRLIEEVRRLTPAEAPNRLVEGHLDGVLEQALHGWIHAPGLPGLRLSVSIALDGRPWRRVLADRFREDLAAAGKGDGAHAFMVDLEACPPARLIEVHLAETDWLLGRIECPVEPEPQTPPKPGQDDDTSQCAPTPVPFPLHYDAGIHEREIFRFFATRAASRPLPSPPAAEERPETVLVIAFTNRSGSNLLADSLAATGLVAHAEECFSFDTLVETCEREGIHDLASYLAYLNRPSTDRACLAVKLSWDQLFFLTRVGVIPHYWPRIRFAWILREDLLAQAMSHLVAERTGAWAGAYPQDVLSDTLSALTPADLVSKLEEITFAHRQLTSYFSLYGIEPAIAAYEELTADPEQVARRLLSELGMLPSGWRWRFDPAAIHHRKQRTPEMETILNRLKAELRGELASTFG